MEAAAAWAILCGMQSLEARPMLIRTTLALTLLATVGGARPQTIVAHRGASHDAPENTLAAFQLAWEQGADAIEGDFHLTADGEIVCIHDRDTARTAGEQLVVAQSSLEELRALEVGAWKAARFAGERIPTLTQVLAIVPAGKQILIEVKCGPEIVPALEQVLASSPLEREQLRLIAFDAEVIAAAKQRMPWLEAYWLTGHSFDEESERWSNPIEEVLPVLARIGADGLDTSVPVEVVNARFVRTLRATGMQLHTWTIDDEATAARLYWLGVDSITTNRPAYLRTLLPTRDLRAALALHLPFDGDARDAGPSQVSTQLLPAREGARTPSYARGVYAAALELAGEAGAVLVERPLPERGSLAFWYRPRGWYDFQTLVDSPNDANGWELWIYSTGLLRFRAHPRGATLSHAFHQTGDADEWHHIALTWDRASTGDDALRLYVNAALADASAWAGRGWFEAGASFTIGGGHADNTRARGSFDELALFDTALGPNEVRFLMSAALGDG